MPTPAAPQYERSVLATLLTWWEFVPIAMPQLSEDHFHTPWHKDVFAAIKDLHQQGKEIDLISAEVWLRENRKWDDGQIANMVELTPDAVTPDKAEEHIKELADRRTKRDMLPPLKNLVLDIENTGKSATEHLATLERIKEENLLTATVPGLTASQIRKRDADRPRYEKINMGLPFFDNEFYRHYGSHKGTTEVIFGETKHGKSYVAQWKVAQYLDQGYKGIYITMEDIDRSIMERVEKQMKRPELIENLIIVDQGQGCSNLHDIINITKYWNAVIGLDFGVADYLQRIPVQGIDYSDEKNRIVTCTNFLTNLATTEDMFLMLLAQISRDAVKYRKKWNQEPEVSDIYGSSAIEKDAFFALNVFRPNRVEDLCKYDYQTGELTGVYGPNDDIVHKNSVYVRQKLVREGELYRPYFRFVHTNEGLHIPEKDPWWKKNRTEEKSPF